MHAAIIDLLATFIVIDRTLQNSIQVVELNLARVRPNRVALWIDQY